MKDNQAKYPQLRFKGFTDPWEQRKLGKMGYTFTGLSGKTKEDFGHGNAKFVTYMNVFSSPVSNSEMVENVEVDSKQHQVEYGDVFFTTSSETPQEVGMSSVWLETAENIYLNSFCFGYHPMVEFDPYYLAFMLRSPVIRKKFMLLAQGISRYNISKNKVMEMLVPVPEIVEQQKIGSFFKQLDDTITLHQRKLAKLKELKQGYLQKMFPKNGSKFPQLRFAGFADAWEQRKLGDIVVFLNGRAYKQAELLDSGKYPVLRVGNFNTNDKWYYSDLELPAKNYADKGDLLYTWATAFGPHIWKGPKVIYHYHIWKVETTSDISKNFAVHLLDADQAQMTNSLNGSTMVHITKGTMENKIVTIPGISEQRNMARLLDQLDCTIALHQRKLEKLQELKKGYLQKMFC
ncbi:restriction endonuclease subunit S [Lactiplantibacillus plantarum]|uniref:restriction endonuclease subunit S n=1 Tax=Lactiplantibacillus plantarum TaxID=1590 RepID=UPI0020A7365E|nr:restriction endonuclease subunit S [Lactiplantibacillus plantarum]